MILLGIDVGSTSLKISAFTYEGKMISTFREEYIIEEKPDGRAEINADTYWKACIQALFKVNVNINEQGYRTECITALSITSQGTTYVPVDINGQALGPAVVWMDSRAGREAKLIEKELGIERIFGVTGQPEISARYLPAKLLHMKKNNEGTYIRTYKFLCMEDYIINKLTGCFVTEYTLASITEMMDIRKKQWWDDIFDVCGLSKEKMPEILPPGEIVGQITAEASRITGLPAKTIVTTGAFDHVAAALGVGNIASGTISESTGGVLALFASIDQPFAPNSKNVPVLCHLQKDKYYFLPWCFSAGLTLRWLIRTLYLGEMPGVDIEIPEGCYKKLEEEASAVQPGSNGLIMLPHLLGAGYPELDSNASGVFAGIRLNHTRAHFARSLFESLAYMLKRNVENIEILGTGVSEIRALGGGSKIDLINQIKADITGKTVHTYGVRDAGTLGAAMIAGKATGVIADYTEYCKTVITINKSFIPNTADESIYEKGYQKYKAYYQALKPVFQM